VISVQCFEKKRPPPPRKIWLQWEGDLGGGHGEVTWCVDKIHSSDTCYVRAGKKRCKEVRDAHEDDPDQEPSKRADFGKETR
jgi:hypothetical protein